MMATMTTATGRRRNMRAENCRACGAFVQAGEGYLYRDTATAHGRRHHRTTGRWGWFVKCEGCHDGEKTRATVAMEKAAAARADESPRPRPWSISQVKKWAVVRTTHDGDVAIRIDAGAFSEVISRRDPIDSGFTAPTDYTLEQTLFAGKPLSDAAAAHLSGQIQPIVSAVQIEERESGNAAAALLAAAGAIVKPTGCGYAWRVEYEGGRYTLWGRVGGKNRVAGLSQPNEQGRWVETTAEELIHA